MQVRKMSVGWVGFVERILTMGAKQFCRMTRQLSDPFAPRGSSL